ncbi:MAG TPA: ABC transporter permease [Stellaceae bacterium]|nr:ABC transporter permease [Stellaceae bacterium]
MERRLPSPASLRSAPSPAKRERGGPVAKRWGGEGSRTTLPVLTLLFALLLLWYLGAVGLNRSLVLDRYERDGHRDWTLAELVTDTWSMTRPILPAPHQVFAELDRSVLEVAPTSPRSLLYHGWVTLGTALLGFAIGGVLGIGLAVGIVHVKVLERSLMPWLITSQTIPILAIAPMIVGVLGRAGLPGIIPKAIISAYLCFFPVTIGMSKGLVSPEPLQLDLVRTYSANRWQIFWKLRWPASLAFLFTSLKVAIALSIVGAIVGELPTGAQAGLGARILSGSYYGQTAQIWASLIIASLLAGGAVASVGWVERLTRRHMGSTP